MTFKEYIKDLCDNIEIMFNAEREIDNEPRKFSPYHFIKYVSNDIEFLGKCLIASDEMFNNSENGYSRYCFNYAILKLDSFKDYRNYIKCDSIVYKNECSLLHPIKFIKSKFKSNYKRDNYNKLKSLSTNTNNIEDFISMFSKRKKCKFDFYSVRCGFTHQNSPTHKVEITSNTNKPIYNKNNIWFVDSKKFYDDIINACNELLSTKNNIILNFLQKPYLDTSYCEDETLTSQSATGICEIEMD